MPFTFTMPKLSPTMQEGVIAKWHKKEGDLVEPGDLLLEVATDKATVEHNAIDAGYIRKILKKEGNKATVNEPLAIFTEKQNESIDGYEPEGIKPQQIKSEIPAAALPKAKNEEPQRQQKPIMKASFSGSLSETKSLSSSNENISPQKLERVLASPLAKSIAKQQELDLSQIQGSGPHGRIMSRDLAQAMSCKQNASLVSPGQGGMRNKDIEHELTPMRKVIGDRLQYSKSTIPHFYIHQEAHVEQLVKLREEVKKLDKNFTINDFIIKAVAVALRLHPEVNSGFNAENNTIVRYGNVDLSIAVTIQGGLITPIVKNADRLSLAQISETVKALAIKAKEGRLSPEEFLGGSFTISNLGMFGVTDFQAIVNPPQAAILAIGAIQEVPVVRNNAVVPGKVLSMVLSCDHRVIDGAEGAQFMQTLKKLLENPILSLAE